MGNALLGLLSTPLPLSPLEVIAAFRMAAKICAESKKVLSHQSVQMATRRY